MWYTTDSVYNSFQSVWGKYLGSSLTPHTDLLLYHKWVYILSIIPVNEQSRNQLVQIGTTNYETQMASQLEKEMKAYRILPGFACVDKKLKKIIKYEPTDNIVVYWQYLIY